MPPPTKPGIEANILTPPTLLTPATKEIFSYTASGGVWTSSTPWQVSRNCADGSTQGNIGNDIGIIETSYPVLIAIIGTNPPCGTNLIQEVWNIQQSTSTVLVRQYQKLDASVDRKLSDNRDATSAFSKVINDKLSNCSNQDLYTCCSINLTEILSKPIHHNFLIWGYQLLMHWTKVLVSVSPLPDYEGLRMVPIGERLIIFLVKLQGF